MEQHFGYVVRADGTVPFDDEVSSVHRQMILNAIKAEGHDIYYDPVSNEHKIRNHNANLGRS